MTRRIAWAIALCVVLSLACAAAGGATNWAIGLAVGPSGEAHSATPLLESTIGANSCNSSASGPTACASGSPVPTGSLSSSSSSAATTTLTSTGSQNPSAVNVASASCGVAQLADTGSDSSWGGSGSNSALAVGGLTYGASGPLSSQAITLNGSTGFAETTGEYTGPETFTILAWFKTTTSGSIIGYSSSQTSPNSAANYDRMLWVDNSGHVVWGVYQGTENYIESSSTYANGAWHFVAASVGSAGMQLYVDGALAASYTPDTAAQSYSGWWSLGDSSVNNGGWGDTPSNAYFTGSLAQTAIIPSQLSASQVSGLYADSTLSSYTSAVNALSPVNDWALNDSGAVPYEGSVPGESASATLADASGNGNTATAQGGVTLGASGPPALGSTAISLNGSTGWAQTANSTTNPQGFSIVAWFKTSSSSGGTIIGFTNVQSNSGQADWDRMLWVDNSGKLVWGVYPSGGAADEITSTSAYNNGQWHMAVAEIGPSGMQLWVDGTEVASNSSITQAQNYTGYWHLGWGGETSANWADVPSDVYLTGSLSQVAVIPTQLTGSQIGTVDNAGSAGAYATDIGALSPTSYWPLQDSASNVCGTTEITVQQTVGQTNTCIFPAAAGTCAAPSSSALVTGLGVRSITAPTSSASVTIKITMELSSASPAGVLGLHELPDISYGSALGAAAWAAPLSYPYANSQL